MERSSRESTQLMRRGRAISLGSNKMIGPEGGFREGNRDNGYHRRKRWKRERGESRNPYKQMQIQFPLREAVRLARLTY